VGKLTLELGSLKIESFFMRGVMPDLFREGQKFFNDASDRICVMRFGNKLCIFDAIAVTIAHRPGSSSPFQH